MKRFNLRCHLIPEVGFVKLGPEDDLVSLLQVRKREFLRNQIKCTVGKKHLISKLHQPLENNLGMVKRKTFFPDRLRHVIANRNDAVFK